MGLIMGLSTVAGEPIQAAGRNWRVWSLPFGRLWFALIIQGENSVKSPWSTWLQMARF
jgi:hypothetical protein